MQRAFSSADEAFHREVEAFIATHWPQGAAVSEADHAAWRQAVVARGWSVPEWPVAAGGPGWSATQKFIWLQACAAHGIDVEEDPGAAVVGPLLLEAGSSAQQDRFLPGIRALEERWCIGFAEPEVGIAIDHFTAFARATGDGFCVNGSKTWVLDAALADWMCCLVRLGPEQAFGLFALDMHSAGVRVDPVQTLDGAETMANVTLHDVAVPPAGLLAGPGDGEVYAGMFSTSQFGTLSRSAVAAAQLQVLDEVRASLDPSDALHTRRDEVAVDLQGLQAMELRYVDALARGFEPPFSLALLRVKSRAILLQLGALQVECFGYYALPYPDEMLLHNEGPVGPSMAASSVRDNLARQVAALYEGSVERLKDEMARQLEIDDGPEARE